jgi:hypothetical protein
MLQDQKRPERVVAGTGRAGVREWADPEDLGWPRRRVIDHINGQDLLECGHPLAATRTIDHYKVFIYGRRCPVCHAMSKRNPEAEIRAHREFLQRFGRRSSLLES